MQISSTKISVTLITGFLGAGKTTLLNNLIREYPEKRFAVIENEFGEIGIDSELVYNIDNNNICELANGCICCTLNNDLADLLKDLMASGKPFDHLLVETTGIADPASVIQTFFSDHEIKSAFRMDSVICLADALHFLTDAGNQEEVHRQIAIADILLLNKSAEQKPGILKDVYDSIRSMNPNAVIIETTYGEIAELNILDRFEYGKERVQSYTSEASGNSGKHSISSQGFRFSGAFDIEKFSYWIEYFLYINQSDVFRVKGILNFAGNPQRMILQSVRSSYLLEEGDYWNPGEERENRIVFIGKNLPHTEIREALESLMI